MKPGNLNHPYKVILFMSDNGSAYRQRVRELFGHDQNSISFKQKWFSLKGGKNDIYEGGHRVPFMVLYPKFFPPQQNLDSLVSRMDIHRTLADLIGKILKPIKIFKNLYLFIKIKVQN